MIIYLVLLLPAGSSDLPKAWRATFISLLFGLASNGVYMCPLCYQRGGSLLHCHSTLTLTMSNTQNPVLLRHAVSQIAAQFSIHGIRRIHPRIHPVFSVSKLTRKSAESVSAHGSLLTRYLSVALSLESPPPDVIRHPAL